MRAIYIAGVFAVVIASSADAFPGVQGKESKAVKEVSNLHDCRVKLHGMEANANANEKNWRETEKKLLKMEQYFQTCQADKKELQEKVTKLLHERGFAPPRKGLFEFIMTVGKILGGSPEATKEKWRSEFEAESQFSSSKTICCFEMIQVTFFTILENVIDSMVSFIKSPFNTITGIWTKADSMIEVATNLLDVMILVIVLNALALGILEIRKLFQGLKKIVGLLWNMPIITIVKKMVSTTTSALNMDKEIKGSPQLSEVKTMLEEMKKDHDEKMSEMIKSQAKIQEKQKGLQKNLQEQRYVSPQKRVVAIEEVSAMRDRRIPCKYCGMTGHRSETCWKQFGRPSQPRWGVSARRPSRSPQRSRSPVKRTVLPISAATNVRGNE